MKYDYDIQSDILLLSNGSRKLDHGNQSGNFIAHHRKDGHLIQIEILDASKEVARMLSAILKKRSKH